MLTTLMTSLVSPACLGGSTHGVTWSLEGELLCLYLVAQMDSDARDEIAEMNIATSSPLIPQLLPTYLP